MYESSVERSRRWNVCLLFVKDEGFDGTGVDVGNEDVEGSTFQGEDFGDSAEGGLGGGVYHICQARVEDWKPLKKVSMTRI